MQELNSESNILTESPDFRLYSAGQMVAVTIFCSVIGGGLLLASNFSKLGEEKKARRTVYLSIAFFIVQMIFNTILIGLFEPRNNSFLIGLNMVAAVVFGFMAEKWQGADYAEFIAQGGRRNSSFNAAILGLFVTVCVMAFLMLVSLAFFFAA